MNLEEIMNENQIKRLSIGGLATDYYLLNTVKDAN